MNLELKFHLNPTFYRFEQLEFSQYISPILEKIKDEIGDRIFSDVIENTIWRIALPLGANSFLYEI